MPRYMPIPKAEDTGLFLEEPDGKRHPLLLSFARLHELGIWGSELWLESSDTMAARAYCREKIPKADELSSVMIPDDYFGHYQRIARKAAPDLRTTHYERAPQAFAAARISLLGATVNPPTKPPEPEAETSTDTQPADEPASKDE